jgi:hypothetical protein
MRNKNRGKKQVDNPHTKRQQQQDNLSYGRVVELFSKSSFEALYVFK